MDECHAVADCRSLYAYISSRPTSRYSIVLWIILQKRLTACRIISIYNRVLLFPVSVYILFMPMLYDVRMTASTPSTAANYRAMHSARRGLVIACRPSVCDAGGIVITKQSFAHWLLLLTCSVRHQFEHSQLYRSIRIHRTRI